MAGIYVHIPFCKQKCHYCDFYSSTQLEHRGAVLSEILNELESEKSFIGEVQINTIYFGGGTPSLCRPDELQAVINKIKSLWDCAGLKEITIEANPDDLTVEYLCELARSDINRLSIGIQSFVDRDLKFMNRRHNAGAGIEAVRNAQKAGFDNITIDLIYGIPGMSQQEWEDNIRTALSLNVQHISAYHLTIEQGTKFGTLAAEHKLFPIHEMESERQYLILGEMLAAGGYEHYEISNFARDASISKHNSSYWTGEHYLGVGPSAHSFNGSVRRYCSASVEGYLTARQQGYKSETLSEVDRYNELLMTSLRTAEGLDLEVMLRNFGEEFVSRFHKDAENNVNKGLLIRNGSRYYIPEANFLLSDLVISDLFIG